MSEREWSPREAVRHGREARRVFSREENIISHGRVLNNNTAGVREREEANRTREAGHLDEIQGVVANAVKLHRNGAVGFIDWLDPFIRHSSIELIREGHPPGFIESESHAR